AAFRVVGPGRPVPAAVGSDVVLPCRLSPKSDARDLEIRWIRHRFSETVHHYRAGEDQYGEQLRDYEGRTELARDGLAGGDLDLHVARVRPSDDGQYVCTVKDGPDYQEATMELEVTAPFFDDARPFMAALGVFLGLSLALAGLSAYLYRRKGTQTRELGESFAPLPPPK
ncbi:MOG protein, partial [Caloenas nicobarica]|nr:MOG protein [Caloenas nicobarica]